MSYTNLNIATCSAPVNIAVIKYWGKRDEDLILPINDSISSTISMDDMRSTTTIITSPNFKENHFWLNDNEENFDNPRILRCIEEVKKKATPSEMLNWKLHICSHNNFPTAAGLASSAAGYACLVATLTKLYGIEGNISGIARLGSGSACRSIYGGWVHWQKGSADDGSDSFAYQITGADHWPEMRIIILVASDRKKAYSSTSGMKTSVLTSTLLKYRAEHVVPGRIKAMINAIKDKDFDSFAEITMKDSNQFHAMCMDTFPPCFYLNDVSRKVIEMVHSYNRYRGENRLAYTFDAGPNACLYLLEKDLTEISALIKYTFPNDNQSDSAYPEKDLNVKPEQPGLLKSIFYTKVGDGPKVLTSESEHLLDPEGNPKKFS